MRIVPVDINASNDSIAGRLSRHSKLCSRGITREKTAGDSAFIWRAEQDRHNARGDLHYARGDLHYKRGDLHYAS